jgi:predicted acetyltransferase
MDLELRAPEPGDLPAYFGLRAQAFAVPASERDDWLARADPRTMLCAYHRGRMVGGVRSEQWGQWFGGRCLPMGAVASVVVAAEARGLGVAARMLAAVLARMHEQGTVVSTLHPATPRPYRAAGWEVAGDFSAFAVPTRSLARLHHGEPEQLTRIDREDWSRVQLCYERAAPAHPGWIQRPAARWEWLAEARLADQGYVYGVEGDDGELAGYVAYAQSLDGQAWGYGIRVHELVALTPEAHATLWSLLGAHAMQVESVVVPGALVDDLLLLLPEQDLVPRANNRWMHRLVDVAGALTGRGWPAERAGELHLQVGDPVAPWNAGRFVLRVEGGGAAVEPGGTGELRLGIGALSALAAGRFPARTLAAAGLVHPADPVLLATADALFAAPHPHLLDDF